MKFQQSSKTSVFRFALFFAGLVLLFFSSASHAADAPMIVADGKPNAQIIIAEKPPRMVDLAAKELQTYIKKISGAELPIATAPSPDVAVKIFVGRSSFTDDLGITAEGLHDGAYRMVSGPDWLVLLGEDFDFIPPQPSSLSRNEKEVTRINAEWDKITGANWMNPMWAVSRRFNNETGLWMQDEGGSFNAVNGFLSDLGVRWYMPGEIGEVVPSMASIPLPEVDRTAQPDYPVRFWHGAYQSFHADTVMWDRRLGINAGFRHLGAALHVHGLKNVYSREEMQKKHPDFYAQVGGKPNFHHANLLSEELVQETAKYARAVFDQFNEPAVSIWPADGLLQCETSPEMPQSEYVGQFMERVAKEVAKTHPDRVLTFGAYSGYRSPPESIQEFSPNLLLFLAAHRPGLDDPEIWEERMKLVNGWKQRMPNQPIIRNANSYYEMVIHPRSFARELKALKGVSLGDWNEVRRRPGGNKRVVWTTPGIDHLNSYINARFLWDADQNIEEVLNEYHTLFYGPAAEKTKEAFDFAEANYSRGVDGATFSTENRIVFVEKLQEAKKMVPGTLYGQRIDAVLADLKPLDELRADLEKEIEARDRKDAKTAIVADGTDARAPTYFLLNDRTGEEADIKTSFQMRWEANELIFDITCEEPDMANNFSTKDVWSGENVSILIESQPGTGDYYQFEINPEGDFVDNSRRENKNTINTRWSSRAKVKVENGKDAWRIAVRFPIMPPEEGALDPFHNIVGSKPTPENPWFFQVGRVRVRDGNRTIYAFTPTDRKFHNILNFARMQVGGE